LQTDFGPEPNERFVDVVKQHFGAEARIVVGCAMGVRSGKAARLLMDAGYTNVVEQKSGFDGSRDAFGRKSPGWRDCKLPLELGQPPDRSYAALQRESPK
jgi:rhodanese-related sulfurtransferase